MNNNSTDTTKTDKPATAHIQVQAPISSNTPFIFQIFFLAPDQSQDVEVLETKEIDFDEINQRLKLGESVFIKYKNPEITESYSQENEGKEQDFWYFKRC
jgi:hypothetical protein